MSGSCPALPKTLFGCGILSRKHHADAACVGDARRKQRVRPPQPTFAAMYLRLQMSFHLAVFTQSKCGLMRNCSVKMSRNQRNLAECERSQDAEIRLFAAMPRKGKSCKPNSVFTTRFAMSNSTFTVNLVLFGALLRKNKNEG